MQNRYPTWVNVLVAAIVAFGLFFAMPNIYGEDPAVQVALKNGDSLAEASLERVVQLLEADGLATKGAFLENGQVLVRLPDEEVQFKAQSHLRDALGDEYLVALNLAPSMPGWMRAIGLQPMSLGLDLRGGVHFLFEVDMPEAISKVMKNYASEFKVTLQDEGIRYLSVRDTETKVIVALRSEEDRDSARRAISDQSSEVQMLDTTVGGSPSLEIVLTEVQLRERQDFAVEQNITTLRNRVNALGVAEPLVQRQGLDRIVVQLPGVQDSTKASEIIGATATLSFHLADQTNNPLEADRLGRAPPGSLLFDDRNGQPVLLKRDVIVTGDQITGATAGFSEGQPAVFVDLDQKGARRMLDTTKKNIDRGMGVVFIEQNRRYVERNGVEVAENYTEESVISVATIRGVFSKSFQITGLTSIEARDLALLLRAGSLAAPIYMVEERTIGPSLGKDNIEQGRMAVIVGFLAVVVFMLIYYRVFGIFANLALLTNLVMIVALLSLLQASLTLPGIAGIVLTVGMAVDANVLIFERIREELRNGITPQAAIHSGYEKALSSIADANITTFFVALILLALGTGPIKGFAVTLALGIATSMFTAIVGTRALVNLIYGNRRVERLAI